MSDVEEPQPGDLETRPIRSPNGNTTNWRHKTYNRQNEYLKLLRVTCDSPESTDAAAENLAAGACDMLQLDWSLETEAREELDFLAEWKRLHKYFFLDQRLKLITNAGGSGVLPRVEALGAYLREHGDPQVPLTAVRGDNIFARLTELSAEGIEFPDAETGEKLPVDSGELRTAQVQLGAGPMVAALEEESRIIVLGAYDPAAPFVAAGVYFQKLVWKDYATIAQLALSSILSKRFAISAQLSERQRIVLKPNAFKRDSLKGVQEWLEKELPRELQWADVHCNIAELRLEQTERDGLLLSGIAARPPDGTWRVKFEFQGKQNQPRVAWSHVPRDAINVSVDTRPASDWL